MPGGGRFAIATSRIVLDGRGLQKPFTTEALASKVRDVLDSRA